MAFGYTLTTLSGINPGVSMPVDAMRFISSFMTSTLGWTLTEDRSAQAGSNSKIILQSNGEDNTASTFYFIMTSGTDNIGIQAATFWNTTTHTVGSGAAAPAADTTITFNASNDKIQKFWISGDKDGVVLITRRALDYDGTYVGRIRTLYPAAMDPFPVYVIGDTTATSIDLLSTTTSNAHSFLDATTVLSTNEADWESPYTSPVDGAQAPDNIFGSTERFTCFPIIAGVSDASPVRRAVRGFSTNIWTTIGPSSSSIDAEDIFLAADNKTYQVFFSSSASTRAVVIRRS